MTKREPIILHPGDNTTVIQGVGDTYRYLATGKETDGRYFFVDATVAPGGGPPPHIQTREDEGFIVLEGELVFHIDGKKIIAQPGTFLNVPPNVVHSFKNESDKTVRLLFFFVPAGIEGFFSELGAINAKPNTPEVDFATVKELGAKYGVKFPS